MGIREWIYMLCATAIREHKNTCLHICGHQRHICCVSRANISPFIYIHTHVHTTHIMYRRIPTAHVHICTSTTAYAPTKQQMRTFATHWALHAKASLRLLLIQIRPLARLQHSSAKGAISLACGLISAFWAASLASLCQICIIYFL